jgi:signal transduction histidine kinase
MLPKTFSKGFDKGRLRNLLALIFLALAVPTAVLIWQGYSQLKWEAFHQYRGVAEELTSRIDARLIEMINSADARSFADYTFLVVTGEPSANFVQRSPLSTYPVAADLPGVVGYFQVDSDGAFSTPLLPPPGTAANQLGIGPDEYVSRLQLADEIQAVLADNRLVRSRPEIGRRLAPADDLPTAAFEEEKEADEYAPRVSRARQFGAERESPSSAALARSPGDSLTEGVIGGFMDEASSDKDVANKREAMPLEQAAKLNETYSQQVFDQLNVASEVTQMTSGSDGTLQAGDALGDDAGGKIVPAEQRLNTIGKVSDLKLDAALQKKSQDIERDAVAQQRQDGGARTELTTATNLRISTFESEVDPFEFSLLDSGHFVLFRKVWRDGERYIQGLLIDQEIFTQNIIGARFMETALSGMSNLIVAYQDDVMQTLSRSDAYRYANGTEALDGALLYRNRLSAPLDSLELIFSIRRLAPGPGASVLGWVTVVLAIVFVGGFFTLYRLGLSQINLARQQQDFVSAVNHELKTPLTSIRMYGEMLKEGWADEEKRQSYYEFIHDESERLTRLISNVLQLAKITRNEPQFDLKPTPVGGLLSNIESKIASQVERAGFDLTFNRDQAADQATIRIDEDCFAQIIINLVDNAIKFSKDADRKAIEISSLLTSDSQVVFAVRDFGPGIPKDQMKKIFKLFYRSESELTRETVGTGIGLAIVHQLTLAMHGKVDVINQQPGAQFAVSFSACD